MAKERRDHYLEVLKLKENTTFTADMLEYMNYTMTKEQVHDSYNVLTHHTLKELYDKHNIYYTDDDFVKKKHKNVSIVEKYMFLAKSMAGYSIYFVIIFMSLGEKAQTGRRMAMSGLLFFLYIAFELKKPNEQIDMENPMVDLVNEYCKHPVVTDWLGEET